MANAASYSDSPLKAIGCMLLGGALLTLNDAVVKSLAADYPTGQVLFLRGLFVFVPIAFLAWRAGGIRALRVKSLKGQGLRAVCVIASSFCFVTGLAYLPLADAIAVAFAGPLFITAMAPLFLGERVGWRRWAAVSVGFLGVLVMVRPTGAAVNWAVIFPLGAVFFGTFRDLVTRRLSRSETSEAVLFVTTAVVALAGLATWPLGWAPVVPVDLWRFAASGLLIGGAHFFMIEAFRLGEAALVAPFKYGNMIWAVLFGYLFFGHLPDAWTLIGASIVVACGLYIFHRESRRARVAAATEAVPTRP